MSYHLLNSKLNFLFLSLLWIFISFKPEWSIPGFKFIAPVNTLLLYFLLVLWLFSKLFSNYQNNENALTKYYFLFLILMVISSIFARNTGLPRDIVEGMLLLFVTYLATTTFSNNDKRTFLIFNIFILGNLFIAILSIIGGGMARSIALFSDQNDLALAMNILVPITIFLGLRENDQIKKLFYYFSSIIFITAIVMSNSRGGFLGLIAVFLYIWFKSPAGKIKTTFVVLVLSMGMIYFAPQSFWDEMQTIREGTEESTASTRVYFWKIAIREFVDHPIIGVGVHNYGAWLPDYVKPDDVLSDGSPIPTHTRTWGRVCHSIYFTLLAELGIVGVILFLTIIYCFFKEIKQKNSLQKKFETLNKSEGIDYKLLNYNVIKCQSLGNGLQAGMLGFLVSGTFLSVLYYPHMWILCTLGVTLGNCINYIKESIDCNIDNQHLNNNRQINGSSNL